MDLLYIVIEAPFLITIPEIQLHLCFDYSSTLHSVLCHILDCTCYNSLFLCAQTHPYQVCCFFFFYSTLLIHAHNLMHEQNCFERAQPGCNCLLCDLRWNGTVCQKKSTDRGAILSHKTVISWHLSTAQQAAQKINGVQMHSNLNISVSIFLIKHMQNGKKKISPWPHFF